MLSLHVAFGLLVLLSPGICRPLVVTEAGADHLKAEEKVVNVEPEGPSIDNQKATFSSGDTRQTSFNKTKDSEARVNINSGYNTRNSERSLIFDGIGENPSSEVKNNVSKLYLMSEIFKQANIFPEKFAPIPADTNFNSKSTILLPLIPEEVQTLSVAPSSPIYDRDQYIKPLAVPPEGQMNGIVIKAIESIERKTDKNKLEVQPLFSELFPLPGALKSEIFRKPETEKSEFTSIAGATRQVDVGQQTVSSSGQEVLRVIDSREKPELRLIKTGAAPRSPAFTEEIIRDNDGFHHEIESVSNYDEDDGKRAELPSVVSVQEITGKSIDKICFILNKKL